jgi:hypothetical protein
MQDEASHTPVHEVLTQIALAHSVVAAARCPLALMVQWQSWVIGHRRDCSPHRNLVVIGFRLFSAYVGDTTASHHIIMSSTGFLEPLSVR